MAMAVLGFKQPFHWALWFGSVFVLRQKKLLLPLHLESFTFFNFHSESFTYFLDQRAKESFTYFLDQKAKSFALKDRPKGEGGDL